MEEQRLFNYFRNATPVVKLFFVDNYKMWPCKKPLGEVSDPKLVAKLYFYNVKVKLKVICLLTKFLPWELLSILLA